MRKQQLPLIALAIVILVVGLAFAGVRIETVIIAAAILACPLMMLFMHGHSGGHHREHPNPDPGAQRDVGAAAGQRHENSPT